MGPLSRRRALQLGGLGLASLAAGGAGLAWVEATRTGPAAGAPLRQPAVEASRAGELLVTLEASRGRGTLGGREAVTLQYNGGVPGPTLSLQQGDHLGVNLVNRLDEPTNLHTHGLEVDPHGNGDNPFVTIRPGESFRYDYEIHPHHPSGTFWYHPHLHRRAADQVFGGLYGAIIIRDPVPLEAAVDRVLVISDISLDTNGAVATASVMHRMAGRHGDLVLVNGQLRPSLEARAGARERWRIVNSCVSRYLRLRLDGQDLRLIGVDLPLGGRISQIDELLLAPGNRADLIVTPELGTSFLRTLPYDRGSMGMGMESIGSSGSGVVDLATLTVTGTTPSAPPGLGDWPAVRDLRRERPTTRRQLTLAMRMGMGGPSFTIDGRAFDDNRVDQSVPAGAIEDWTIVNSSQLDHPFHLHVWPMQLLAVGERTVSTPTWLNVVNVPANSFVTVRVDFAAHTGRTVFHCHILDHEDSGMMGVVEVGGG